MSMLRRIIEQVKAGRPGPVQPAAPAAPVQWKALGNAALQRGDLAEAKRCYLQAVEAEPADPLARLNLGFVLLEEGSADVALRAVQDAISLRSSNAEWLHEAYYLLARAQRLRGRPEEAQPALEQALRLRPDFQEALREGMQLLQASGRHEEALAWARRWASAGGGAEAVLAAAMQLLLLGRREEALQATDAVLEQDPDHTEALEGRSLLLLQLSRPGEAVHCLERILALREPTASLLSNLAAAQHADGQLGPALAAADRALALEPGHRDAAYNRARVLIEMLRVDEAAAQLAEALAADPDDADLRWNHSLALLLGGRIEEAWPHYEARWRSTAADAVGAEDHAGWGGRRWSGDEDVRGRHVLVFAEQGLGDSIQFLRYVPLLQARGARVSLALPPSLQALAGSAFPDCAVLPDTPAPASADLHCPMLGLPLAFRTGLSTIPAEVPYLRSDPALRAAWQERLGHREGLRVGLCWSGNPAHRNDANRSLPLELLRPLAQPGVQFVSLHQSVREGDRAVLEAWPGGMLHFGDALRTLSDTAALLDALDLVISVDTSVAHLAGALGRPTWILLPHVPDWRWMLGREDSPWYPTMRLFRQESPGDWTSVVRRVQAALGERRADAAR